MNKIIKPIFIISSLALLISNTSYASNVLRFHLQGVEAVNIELGTSTDLSGINKIKQEIFNKELCLKETSGSGYTFFYTNERYVTFRPSSSHGTYYDNYYWDGKLVMSVTRYSGSKDNVYRYYTDEPENTYSIGNYKESIDGLQYRLIGKRLETENYKWCKDNGYETLN